MKDYKLIGAYSWAQPAHILLFQKPINPEQDRMTAYLRSLRRS